jgi:flagellar biosynthesis protein FliR
MEDRLSIVPGKLLSQPLRMNPTINRTAAIILMRILFFLFIVVFLGMERRIKIIHLLFYSFSVSAVGPDFRGRIFQTGFSPADKSFSIQKQVASGGKIVCTIDSVQQHETV